MEKTRVIFMGTPEFGRAILQELLDEQLNVVAVVCQPDKLVGRKQILTFPVVKQLAVERGIEVIQPLRIREDRGVEALQNDVRCTAGKPDTDRIIDMTGTKSLRFCYCIV